MTSPTLQGLLGAAAGAVVGGGVALGRWAYNDIRRGVSNLRHHHGPTPFMEDTASRKRGNRPDSDIDDRSVRRRIDFMDQLPVYAGGLTTRNRYQNKQRLKSGRLGRKLQRETAEFIQRWQRIYNFGNSTDNDFGSYPSNVKQWENPGIIRGDIDDGYAGTDALNKNTGRLQLSHVAPVNIAESGPAVNWQFMPGYLFDITSWRNKGYGNYFAPMRRVAFDENGHPRLVTVCQQASLVTNADSFKTTESGWAAESGPTGDGFPDEKEQRSVLSWSDIRTCFYAAKKRCSKVHIEFVQFKDKKYTLDFYPDGEPWSAMTSEDQRDVEMFWINEFKRLTFNPLTVNTFIRNKAIKVMKSESFCINADDANNEDPMPPAVQKSYFKRFNRLCKWNWNTGGITVNPAYVSGGENKPDIGGLENPDYQQTSSDQMLPFLNPNARVYMYIRAEDFEPVSGETNLSTPAPAITYTRTSAIGNLPAQPAGTEICGVDINAALEPGVTSHYYAVPRLCQAQNQYSSDDHVTFDIIVRNKWLIQM